MVLTVEKLLLDLLVRETWYRVGNLGDGNDDDNNWVGSVELTASHAKASLVDTPLTTPSAPKEQDHSGLSSLVFWCR
jgi:hypothetical protein